MTLRRLEISNFRCIAEAGLELDSRFNLIVGRNASGKTSLLEAFFFLSCGRSFRSAKPEVLVREGCESFSIVGYLEGPAGKVVGVRGGVGATEARLAGSPVRGFAELAAAVPVQVIDPEVHKLLEEGPARRRRFLDWGVFHVEQSYIGAWRRYHRALQQRAAALKTAATHSAVAIWDRELAESGEFVTGQRSAYVAALAPKVSATARDLLGIEVTLRYTRGWSGDRSLQQALRDSWGRDRAVGATTVGPHRADLTVFVDGVAAKGRVSRGQQKLLAAALVLGQLEQRAATSEGRATLLLDDPAAELDERRLGLFLSRVRSLPVQLVITSLVRESVDIGLSGPVFHVEQGRFLPVL